MDNLTHSLVGLTAAKAGLERLSPGAGALCILAANSPDCDVAVLLFGDRWTYLHHHRGITHAIVGVAFLALFLPLVFYGVDRMWSRFRGQAPKTKFWGLMLASVLVTATHPLLDWTNNYGMRFFLPWSSKWYYGDIVYIIDPYLWLLLGGTCFLLSAKTRGGKIIWGTVAAVLTALVIISPRGAGLPFFFVYFWITAIVILVVLFVLGTGRRFGNKIAIAAFAIMLCYWSFLAYAHSRALESGYYQATNRVLRSDEPIRRLAVMPTLASPLHWDCVFETDGATYRFGLRLLSDNFPSTRVIRYEKPSGPLAEAMAEVSTDRPVQVFLSFARFPVAKLADPNCTTETLLQLADLRYTEPGSRRGTFTLEQPVDCPTDLR
ncbi:MAG TPA: metal-dependent hydrolase, partial [Pyrinomonadaceae bacterium]|nr:metal-dependent hydrolase [Pyrinomonadaceae bacterium]